jgi:hypothetical protein
MLADFASLDSCADVLAKGTRRANSYLTAKLTFRSRQSLPTQILKGFFIMSKDIFAAKSKRPRSVSPGRRGHRQCVSTIPTMPFGQHKASRFVAPVIAVGPGLTALLKRVIDVQARTTPTPCGTESNDVGQWVRKILSSTPDSPPRGAAVHARQS